MFVDRVRIEVVAGDGGRGSGSFRREKYVPRGGPDGGDGGAGGSVILRAAAGIDSLAALAHRAQWRAGHGESGGPANCHGRSAADLVLEVPPGTIVTDEQTGLVLKDLATAGDWIVAARGGSGGFGNVHFKSSTNRAPRTTTPGGKGEARRLALELKVIADVGLVGLPNAGKSTLLSRLSRARPQIADYAFTTKSPMLGIVAVDRDRSFVLADLPGLIEGAHAGTGLGHEFLRHVERAGILVHVVEPAPLDGSDPVANHRTIRVELAAYDPDLARRPEITIVSKAELPTAAEVRDRLEASLGRPVLAVSAVTGTGLDQLVRAVVRELDRPRTASAQPVAAVPDVAAAAARARGVPAEPRAVAAPGESAAEGPAGAGDDALLACRDDAMLACRDDAMLACRDDAMLACRDDAMLACRDDAMAPGAVTLGDTVLVADVGNTRIKLAAVADWSGGPGDGRLPRLIHRQDLSSRDFHPDNLERWLAQAARGTAVLLVGSVHDAAAARLEAAVAEVSATRYRALRQRRIGHADLPLEVRLPEPHRVGIDRLAAATAAALIRPADQPAIVIDCGTAATVGCLAADGAFLGGAILAGPALLARALAEGTSRLPEVESLGTEPPPALPGRDTHEAIAAGIGWGIRGAIRELHGQARLAVGGEPTVFLTGGWRGAVRDVLPGVVELPDLVLLGLALAAPRACRR